MDNTSNSKLNKRGRNKAEPATPIPVATVIEPVVDETPVEEVAPEVPTETAAQPRRLVARKDFTLPIGGVLIKFKKGADVTGYARNLAGSGAPVDEV